MQRILTPDEFIARSVCRSPSLFAGPTYDEVKFRILDQLLNTIGNGIENSEEFMEEPVTESEFADAQKWFACSRAAYGYMAFRLIGEYQMPEGQSSVVERVDMLDLHPEIQCWIEFDTNTRRNPYPNFQKQYSLVWGKMYQSFEFEALGKEWVEAAIWFYAKCLDYIMDDDAVKSYHSAFPKPTQHENEKTISEYKRIIGDYSRYPTNDDITHAYECEFIGDRTSSDDVAAFITRRWQATRDEIVSFIHETLGHLELLKNRA